MCVVPRQREGTQQRQGWARGEGWTGAALHARIGKCIFMKCHRRHWQQRTSIPGPAQPRPELGRLPSPPSVAHAKPKTVAEIEYRIAINAEFFHACSTATASHAPPPPPPQPRLKHSCLPALMIDYKIYRLGSVTDNLLHSSFSKGALRGCPHRATAACPPAPQPLHRLPPAPPPPAPWQTCWPDRRCCPTWGAG